VAPAGPRRHWLGLLPLAVVLVVLLLAEVAVRTGRSHLHEPRAWPLPELQRKYEQIGALEASGRPDVVLVGDSMMDAGGNPAALAQAAPGLSFYNASIAGEQLPVITDWTTRIVVPRLHPKVVVIGFTSNEFNPHALDAKTGVKVYRGSRVVRAAEGIGSPVDRADAFLRDHSMLYRYRGELRSPFRGRSAQDSSDPALTPAGRDLAFANHNYLPQSGTRQGKAVAQGVMAALNGFRINHENVQIMQGLINSLRRQGARVLLVAMPVTADLISYHPHGATDYDAAMEAFAGVAERTGTAFAQPGTWPNDLFADPVHVNEAGSARLTAYLAPLIQQEAAEAGLTPP